MSYVPIVHIQSVYAQRLDLTARIPWLYIIGVKKPKLLYIGETFDTGGLISRLGAHFGPYVASTLKQRIEAVAGLSRLHYPVIVVAARLPFAEDRAAIDAASKQVRLGLESSVHEALGIGFVMRRPGWTIISTPQRPSIGITASISDIAAQIAVSFENTFTFIEALSEAAPFHLVLLERDTAESAPDESSVGDTLESIEILIWSYLLSKLKELHGETWWTAGVPTPVRTQCATRREEEGAYESIPPHAYLTLVQLKEIARANWATCGSAFERVAGQQGRDKGTRWLDDLNEIRKQWAHPIKRQHVPLQPPAVIMIRDIYKKVVDHLKT
jgi:hypothetical protein